MTGLVNELLPQSATYALVDVDLGNTAKSGRFTINGIFNPAKTVIIHARPGPYTGKGSLSDEAEMDALHVLGRVLNETTIECFWHAIPGPVRGNFTFQYRLANS